MNLSLNILLCILCTYLIKYKNINLYHYNIKQFVTHKNNFKAN